VALRVVEHRLHEAFVAGTPAPLFSQPIKGPKMFRRRSILTYVSSGTVIAALALSACGGDDDSSSSSGSSTTSSESHSAQSATVVVEKTDLGNILTDGKNQTLYLFLKDTGNKSECNDACAANWPPLTVSGKATAGSGADASLVGTTTRSDGKTQVTYNGHPVYRFSGDQKPGDTAGEGLNAFGASWYVVSPAGDQVTGTASSSSGSGGGSGY
jgi:predicted lipoprotein with Yx(FWY)xxD motif